jgi:hypothetical protein
MMTIVEIGGIIDLLATRSVMTAVTLEMMLEMMISTSSIGMRRMTETTALEVPQWSQGIVADATRTDIARPVLTVTGAESTGADTVHVRGLPLKRRNMKMMPTPTAEIYHPSQAVDASTGARKTNIASETVIDLETGTAIETGATAESEITTATMTEIMTMNDPGRRTGTGNARGETARKT